jgi:hypothetical protein
MSILKEGRVGLSQGFGSVLTFAKKCFVLNCCERDVLCLRNRINHLKPYLNRHNTESVPFLMRTAIPASEKSFLFVSQIQGEDERSRRKRATMELTWF